MKWLLKNIGLTAIAASIVFGTAVISLDLEKTHTKLDAIAALEQKHDVCIQSIASLAPRGN